MSEMFVGCTKCGAPLPVDAEAMRNALLLGEELTAAHDVCPGEEETVTVVDLGPPRRFRCQLTMYEYPLTAPDDLDWPVPTFMGNLVETMAATGVTVESRNFAEAVNGEFTNWLNRTWPKMQEAAAFADLPDPSPATPA